MYNQYNQHNLEANFKEWLEQNSFSRASITNYLADIRKFLSWYSHQLSIQGLAFDLNYLTRSTMELYKAVLKKEKIPVKSINRHLSSIRTFARFCVFKGYIASNPFVKSPNVKESKRDVFASKSMSVGKTIGISLAGFGLVIGLFLIPTLVGTNTNLFSRGNTNNMPAEDLPNIFGTLEGYTASTSADLLTIPITDEKGNLNLTAPYPKIIGHTGALTIEAPQVALRTYNDGPIVLNTEEGSIQFLFDGKKPELPYESAFYFSANDMRNGTLLHVQTEDTTGSVDILNLSSGLPAVSRFRVDSEGNVHIKGNIILDGNLIMDPDSVIFGQVSTETATSSASPESL